MQYVSPGNSGMTVCVKRFQLNRRVLDISHPPYSPDFAPAVFFSVRRQMDWSSEYLW